MVSYLIEGGSVVDPLNKKIERRDLLIADGKFQDLDKTTEKNLAQQTQMIRCMNP